MRGLVLRSIGFESNVTIEGMPLIDQFHSDPNVFIFLISTLAGGTGLNLTGPFLSLSADS